MFGKGDFYILRAKGDSMVDAGIEEDDLLVIERNCPASEGDIVVALDSNNQNTLKRFTGYDENEQCYLLSYENEARYPGRVIKVKSFVVQGIARHVIKAL
jgi:repressor LexA